MFSRTKIIISFVYIKSLILLFSFFILKVNAETKITAKHGDTLLKLSKQYSVPLKELMHKNNFNDAKRRIEGEVIIIPLNNNLTYKVIDGDTLYKIARDHNVSLKDIISINDLDDTSFLKPNQIILLPIGASKKKVVNKKNIQLATRKVFFHQTTKNEKLMDIAKVHKISIKEIIDLNKLKDPIEINPNTKLKIRKNNSIKWLKYGSLMIKWSDWRYLDGNYITLAKNKKNKSFYLAVNCEKRIFNNTLNNSYWNKWYFPSHDFEFKLINDFCDKNFKV